MPDYMFLLESRLSPEQRAAMMRVQELSAAMGFNVYLTGGTVRDLITGATLRDLDFTVEGNPSKIARELEKGGARILDEDEKLRQIEILFAGDCDFAESGIARTAARSHERPLRYRARRSAGADDSQLHQSTRTPASGVALCRAHGLQNRKPHARMVRSGTGARAQGANHSGRRRGGASRIGEGRTPGNRLESMGRTRPARDGESAAGEKTSGLRRDQPAREGARRPDDGGIAASSRDSDASSDPWQDERPRAWQRALQGGIPVGGNCGGGGIRGQGTDGAEGTDRKEDGVAHRRLSLSRAHARRADCLPAGRIEQFSGALEDSRLPQQMAARATHANGRCQ